MTSRERLIRTLNHQTPDRVCVDFGAGGQTGMGAGAVFALRKALFGDEKTPIKIIEPYQMLGEVDEQLREALELDVIGLNPPSTIFGFPNEGWKPFTMHDGTPVLVPELFNWTVDQKGAILLYPQGDTSVAPCASMPTGSFFFDSIIRQSPLEEDSLTPADNCEEFAILSDADIAYYARVATQASQTPYGVYATLPGMGFGDIALVPAPWLKHPRGIRDVEEWYVSTLIRRDYVLEVFQRQCDVALANIERLAPAVGDRFQVVFVSGTDFGTQRGLFVSLDCYRELFKPFHRQVNAKIHQLTNWKTFIHTCGCILELIPDLIEAGFDVLNPVQCSAPGMDPQTLKNKFGKDIVFWGGGVDTQRTLPFGKPSEVYREVRERIEIFNEGGGFVFNSVHNVQSNVPVDNLLAMFRAIKDAH